MSQAHFYSLKFFNICDSEKFWWQGLFSLLTCLY